MAPDEGNPEGTTTPAAEPEAAPVEAAAPAVAATEELPQITTAAEWKRKARAEYRLHLRSSNVFVKVRKPDWTRLVETGLISENELLDAVVGSPTSDGMQRMRIGIDRARRLTPHIVVEPRLVYPNGHGGADLAEDVISVEDIHRDDLLTIMSWALTGTPEAVEV